MTEQEAANRMKARILGWHHPVCWQCAHWRDTEPGHWCSQFKQGVDANPATRCPRYEPLHESAI